MTRERVVSIHHHTGSCRCPTCLQDFIHCGRAYQDGYYWRIGHWANAAMALRQRVPAPTLLTPGMMPTGMWQINLRFLLTGAEWDYLRLSLLDDVGNACEICGERYAKTAPLECHELFAWDDETDTAYLSRILVLCQLCHRSHHVGLAEIIGQLDDVLAHVVEVNHWSGADLEAALVTATRDWDRRSGRTWTGDFSSIGIEPDATRLAAAARRSAAKRREIDRSRAKQAT